MDIDWPTTIPYKLQQTCYAKTTSCKEKSKKKTNFFCHLLRADPNVLLIKAETTRPHYSSSLSLSRRFCCPLFNATREQSFELLPVTLVHAFYIFLLSPEPFTLPSLFSPSGCLCSSHRLFPSITGFALHARTTTHGTHGDAFSHYLRSLSSNSLPSRSIKFFFLLIRLHPRVFYRRQLSQFIRIENYIQEI